MALKGTLKDFSLADIFQLIGIQKKTGVLTLKDGKDVVTVGFVDGGVVTADALHRRLEDRLGTVLVKSGRITEAQLQEALKIQKNTLKRMGNILVENRFIDAQALRDALQIQISQMVYRLFRWRDGEYDFSQEEKVDFDQDHVVPMSAESVLMEGARILDEWPMIEKGIRSFATVFRRSDVEIATAPRSGEAAQEDDAARAVTLNDQERMVYGLVDGRRPVQEIVERCALSEFDTCRILFDLITRQILEEVRSPGQKTAAAPAAPVAAPALGSPILVGAGYVVLVLALGGALFLRGRAAAPGAAPPVPYVDALLPTDAVTPIGEAIGRSRLQRVDFAIQVYYLLYRGYPAELRYLVTSRLLKPEAIVDASGRPFTYEVLPGGYRVSTATGSDTAGRQAATQPPPAY